MENRIYNYGVKKRNAFIKESKVVRDLKREAKKLETTTYHKQLEKELKSQAIARAKARAKRKAYHPSKTNQISKVADEVAHLICTDGPDPFGLFPHRGKRKSIVRSDYFDNLP